MSNENQTFDVSKIETFKDEVLCERKDIHIRFFYSENFRIRMGFDLQTGESFLLAITDDINKQN